MSNISENLELIINARYGKDVRQAIYEAIKDCYEDGKTGSTDLEARQKIDKLLANRSTILKNGENIIFQRFTSDDVSMSMANTVAGIVSSLSDPYDPSSTYKKGSFVYYDNFIWVCSQNISVPEDFNREHWGKVTVTRAISSAVAGMIAIGNDGENLEFKDTRLTYITTDENLTIINPTDEKQMTYIVIEKNYEDLTMYAEMGTQGGGQHGSDVVITPTLQEGVEIATYSIDGIQGSIKAPEGGDHSISLTKAEYKALEASGQVQPGVTYYITDEVSGSGSGGTINPFKAPFDLINPAGVASINGIIHGKSLDCLLVIKTYNIWEGCNIPIGMLKTATKYKIKFSCKFEAATFNTYILPFAVNDMPKMDYNGSSYHEGEVPMTKDLEWHDYEYEITTNEYANIVYLSFRFGALTDNATHIFRITNLRAEEVS